MQQQYERTWNVKHFDVLWDCSQLQKLKIWPKARCNKKPMSWGIVVSSWLERAKKDRKGQEERKNKNQIWLKKYAYAQSLMLIWGYANTSQLPNAMRIWPLPHCPRIAYFDPLTHFINIWLDAIYIHTNKRTHGYSNWPKHHSFYSLFTATSRIGYVFLVLVIRVIP